MTRNQNTFSEAFSNTYFSTNEDNVCFSPVCIHYLKSLAECAATGNTRKEMADVLGEYDRVGQRVLRDRLSADGSIVEFRSDMRVPKAYLSPEYIAEVSPFLQSFENHCIFDESESSTIEMENRLVFSSKWEKKMTSDAGNFHAVICGQKKNVENVPFLIGETVCPYVKTSEYQSVSIPFGTPDKRYSLTIAMPFNQTLHEFWRMGNCYQALNPNKMIKNGVTSVRMNVPKFAVSSTINAKSTLCQMGIKDAFDKGKADFSNIGEMSNFRLRIGNVKQSVRIELDEKGVYASAATCVRIYATIGIDMPPPASIELIFDAPFAFAIWSHRLYIPIFVGLFYHP